ncbi:chalcone isomerase family protein [Flavobacterium tibetense]|jgi:hypothetical protein|uniref:Chalcone isomerase n=1 Tax=Flavobacterium tibetense TaxID=2233533 RepID=A0A365P0X6_9FLAO|nr:chalcone isomerase family protein [Flavobacterium tibetense]RBA28120.1 chalcone isomerase [Flavobacterium tibetense]
MKKQMITFFVLIATAMTMNAQKTVAGVKVDDKLAIEGQNLVLNGVGTRVKMFMDMYVGALYVEKKSTNANEIMASKDGSAIRLTIVSGLISSDKMIDAVTEGFENSTGGKTAPLKSKIDKFISFFKDEIKKGDVFTMVNTDEGVVVYKNNTKKGTIEGNDFKKALFGIWLSAKPADKNLKKAMLGQ